MLCLSVRRLGGVAAVALGLLVGHAAFANTVTLYATEGAPHIPDESSPRGVVGDFPAAPFGSGSWQNVANSPGAKKVNAYVTATELFGHDVAVGDIASITYYTKAPVTQENWFINLYTKATGAGDDASWYKHRFFNDQYTGYTSDGAWHNNSIASLTRTSGGAFPSQTLANWQGTYGAELIQFFSPQTNSALNGNDAQIDGLVVTLNNTEVGSVNFEAAIVPLPPTVWMGITLMAGIVGMTLYKRFNESRMALA